MKTSPIAFKIFIARRVAGLAAALIFAAALYALSWTACRHIVPSWPGHVIQNSGAATDTWFGRNLSQRTLSPLLRSFAPLPRLDTA